MSTDRLNQPTNDRLDSLYDERAAYPYDAPTEHRYATRAPRRPDPNYDMRYDARYDEYADPRYDAYGPVRYTEYPTARRTSPVLKGAVAGLFVAVALVVTFAFASGLGARVMNKVLPATTTATTTTQAGTTRSTSQQSTSGNQQMISGDDATSKAIWHVAGDNNVSNVGCQLITGGDAPHYEVTFHFDDADYTVEVDAYTGAIWSSAASFPESEPLLAPVEQNVEPEQEVVQAGGEEIWAD